MLGWQRGLAAGLLALSLASAPTAGPPAAGTATERLRRATDLAGAYLVRNCDATGRFHYRRGREPGGGPGGDYNILRHAGALHALGMYEQVRPDPRTRAAMVRAARFLTSRAVRPVEGRPDLLAVWSDEEEQDEGEPSEAKLGGAGLGLVGLLAVERVAPGTTSLEVLQGLGRFVLFLQKEDGSFHSKFLPAKGGRDDSWTSLYYPGEAALGLVLLHERDGSPLWLRGAADALAHLARSRRGATEVPADHWALLATERILPAWERSANPLPREQLIAHAVQIVESVLVEAAGVPGTDPFRGALTPGGRTCPTATRVEGLLAAWEFLPDEHDDLRARILVAARDAIDFLLRAQIATGERAGGLPRAVAGESARAAEVRIDYVQHALSAMIQYSRALGEAEGRWN